ncbi:hypothetical protein [Campylobacter sp. RM12651]|uniref:hypothetical protein n=1 Tax=Campylobacter sp. RM12651 TaxID=1660079 RepID=UPI001EFC20C5|nr:hypothetical protein [Campylobacter sp. RM12651]ULO04584.1 hypothetical protein AVBRAN_a0102 [Campylobacter sp. RM12651]
MNILSVDLGYSLCKVIFEKNNEVKEYICPSAISYAFQKDLEEQENIYHYNDEYIKIGAVSNDNLDTLNDDFIIKYSPVFLAHVINELKIEKQINETVLLFGISEINKEILKDLRKILKSFTVNNKEYAFSDVKIFKQGDIYPLIKNKIDDFGDLNENVTVLDIGFFTNDIHYYENGILNNNIKISNIFGVNKAIEPINSFLKDKGLFLSQQEINQYLNGEKNRFKIRKGKKIIDLSEIINKSKEIFTNEIIAILNKKEVINSDIFCIVGGGAKLLDWEKINREIGEERILKYEEDSIYVNAKTYILNYKNKKDVR